MQDIVQEVDRIFASVVNFEIRFSQKTQARVKKVCSTLTIYSYAEHRPFPRDAD